MSLQEMSITEQNSAGLVAEEVYDDGFLRVEHKKYYAACGGHAMKLPRTEFLIFSRLVRTPNRIVTADDLWTSVWASNKPLNPRASTFTSIVYVRSSRPSACRSRRW